MKRLSLLVILLILPLDAQFADAPRNASRDRAVRPWQFFDSIGKQAGILGLESGTVDAYVWPLKLVKDLKLRFRVGNQVIPGETIARRVEYHGASTTITYSSDEFRVRETFLAAPDEPGALLLLSIDAALPVTVEAEFTRDFQLMWPASIGTSFAQWRTNENAFVFGADGYPYAALLGSDEASVLEESLANDYTASTINRLSLGTVKGHAEKRLAFAASFASLDQAREAYRRILALSPSSFANDEPNQFVQIEVPDPALQGAYDNSVASIGHGRIKNPFLGEGLVAGFGPSKGTYRPGFGWFFGRDTFWTTFAMNSYGDLEGARTAIAFIAQFQRPDGRIPHEISQSTSLVDWWGKFPYGIASADATPLFLIAVRDYVKASGDIAFADQMWPRIEKAMAFERATFDSDGLPRNKDIGHGWIEGGPLRDVRIELYQAACYLEALRSLGDLAEWRKDASTATQARAEFAAKQKVVEDRFWLPAQKRYAFALNNDNTPLDQPSVEAMVPMWFDLLDHRRAGQMIDQLASHTHSTDWGMRIIGNDNPLYSPEGYHYGSVWPLFTGWAAVGSYRVGRPQQGFANLMANAYLALEGGSGNTTEVLSGDTFTELSTASPHQIWSAAMVVSPILKGLFGLDVDRVQNRVTLSPQLPAHWDKAALRGVRLVDGVVSFAIEQSSTTLTLSIQNKGKPFALDFRPGLSPGTTITSLTWTKGAVKLDQTLQVPAGESRLTLVHGPQLAYGYVPPPPRLGDTSRAMKIVSEQWDTDGAAVTLTLQGLAGQTYDLYATGRLAEGTANAAVVGPNRMRVTFPAARGVQGYVETTVKLLRPER